LSALSERAGSKTTQAPKPAPLVTGHWSLSIPQRATRIALALWSIALGFGGLSWLLGESSGKLFLDWHGWARPLLPLAMSALWTVLAAHAWWHRAHLSRAGLAARVAFLLLLLAVPSTLYWSSGEDVFPSVNPDSGGATGASLLGSTLGIIAIFGLLPAFLGIRATDTRRAAHRAFWAFFVFSCAAFAVIDHGHASHHAAGQIIGLSLLLGWLPLAWVYFRRFDWTPPARPWLAAAFGWWALLVITGLLTFLPGFSERLKFTHGLVAHAHLAMAGLVTSLHVALLNELRPARPLRTGFWLWQTACAVYVTAMLILGWRENARAGELFRSESWTQLLMALRLLAGLGMTLASLRWLRTAFHPQPAASA
jgi:cytochrome c oxidase cbb3-type subunit 1